MSDKTLVMVVGILILVVGGAIALYNYKARYRQWDSYQQTYIWKSVTVFPYALFGIIIGLIGLVTIVVGGASPLMEKKESVEKTHVTARENYPQGLIMEYQRKYPHNPSGVLEFHISRKVKEGKTREQAIEELAKESGPSELS